MKTAEYNHTSCPPERLKALRDAILDGTYLLEMNPKAIAESMLQSASQRAEKQRDRNSAIRAMSYNGIPQEEIARRLGITQGEVSRVVLAHERPATSNGKLAFAR